MGDLDAPVLLGQQPFPGEGVEHDGRLRRVPGHLDLNALGQQLRARHPAPGVLDGVADPDQAQQENLGQAPAVLVEESVCVFGAPGHRVPDAPGGLVSGDGQRGALVFLPAGLQRVRQEGQASGLVALPAVGQPRSRSSSSVSPVPGRVPPGAPGPRSPGARRVRPRRVALGTCSSRRVSSAAVSGSVVARVTRRQTCAGIIVVGTITA